MQNIPTRVSDKGLVVAGAGWSGQSLAKTASYAITDADMHNAGGDLSVVVSSAASAVDISLPSPSVNKGGFVTIYKPSGNTNAVSLLATGGAAIEGGTANKRFQNLTNELGACKVWSDGANWRVQNFKGTWVANNT